MWRRNFQKNSMIGAVRIWDMPQVFVNLPSGSLSPESSIKAVPIQLKFSPLKIDMIDGQAYRAGARQRLSSNPALYFNS